MDAVHELKAIGHLAGVDMADLDRVGASVSSRELNNLQRRMCGAPDAEDEELAQADVGEIAKYLKCDEDHACSVKECHRRFASHGGGAWHHCHDDVKDKYHSVAYSVDRDSFPSHYHRQVTEDELRELSDGSPWWGWDFEEAMDRWQGNSVLDMCLVLLEETYRLAGCAHVYQETGKVSSGIHVLSRRIPGNTIGLGWFPNAGCSDLVEFHIDSSWDASLQAKGHLFLHECGHTNGLPHTFPGQGRHHGKMSYDPKYPVEPFSTGEAPYTLPRDPSWDQLERQYKPRPVILDDTEPPEPPKPPGDRPTRAEYRRLERDVVRNLDAAKSAMRAFGEDHYGDGDDDDPIVW